MTVRFKFLAGDVNWATHGGTWISQKFNHSGTDYWLVREIVNWEEQGNLTDDGKKYTVILRRVSPGDCYSQEERNQMVRYCLGDDASWENLVSWENLTDEAKVEALHSYGHSIREQGWDGNNYSALFQECQKFANAFVEGDEVLSPIDFSKLPENLLVEIQKNRYGHLEGKPKSDRHNHLISATNVRGEASFYIQEDYNVESFIEDFVPRSKWKDLDEGWTVTVRFSLDRYLVYLSDPSDAYLKHLEQEKARFGLDKDLRPSLFAEIEGVPVYHVHKYGYGEGCELDFWYSTAQYPEELHEECRFRVDELDPNCRVERVGDEPWQESWNRFQEHCKSVIAQAIRDGKIKHAPAPDAAVLGGIKQPEPGSLVLGGQGDRSK
jgi:hypothetical protein